jgi:hypothetical protein
MSQITQIKMMLEETIAKGWPIEMENTVKILCMALPDLQCIAGTNDDSDSK